MSLLMHRPSAVVGSVPARRIGRPLLVMESASPQCLAPFHPVGQYRRIPVNLAE